MINLSLDVKCGNTHVTKMLISERKILQKACVTCAQHRPLRRGYRQLEKQLQDVILLDVEQLAEDQDLVIFSGPASLPDFFKTQKPLLRTTQLSYVFQHPVPRNRFFVGKNFLFRGLTTRKTVKKLEEKSQVPN